MTTHGRNGIDPRREVLREELREAASCSPWFRDTLQWGFDRFVELCRTYQKDLRELPLRRLAVAREQLRNGRLTPARPYSASEDWVEPVDVLCPEKLCERLKNVSRHDDIPDELQRKAAPYALAALDDASLLNSPQATDDEKNAVQERLRDLEAKGTHRWMNWNVRVPVPPGWRGSLSPYSHDPDVLRKFAEDDYRAIALFRLEALCRIGSHRGLITEPEWDVNTEIGAVAFGVGLERSSDQASLPTAALEEFWRWLKPWAQTEAARRGQRLTASEPLGTSVQPDLQGQLKRAVDAPDPSTTDQLADQVARKLASALAAGERLYVKQKFESSSNGDPRGPGKYSPSAHDVEQEPASRRNHRASEPPPDAFLSESDIAEWSGVKQPTLRKRLAAWRNAHHNNDWHRVENPRPRDPRYMYRWGSIKTLVESLSRAANVTAKTKKPANSR